jgi:transposase
VFRGRDVQEFMEMKREGLSVQAISKLTGYGRKTVHKYLLEPEAVPSYGPREKQPSKLDPLLRELRQRGYQGRCTILKDWLQPQRAAGLASAVRRFETPPGKHYGECRVGDPGVLADNRHRDPAAALHKTR